MLVIALVFIVRSCAPQEQSDEQVSSNNEVSLAIPDAKSLYADLFDWDDLSTSDQLYSYSSGGQTLSSVGVDVSEHQGDIDWQQFASEGIEFAYIRAGYRSTDIGALVKDANYDANMQGALSAGLKVGVYFYSQAITEDEAREEADFVCDTIGEQALDYPIAFDFEPSQDSSIEMRIDDLSDDQMTAIAQAFCERIVERGHKAVVYGNQFDLNHFDLDSLRDYGFWYAEYDSKPSSPLSFGIWQYTNSASLDGCDEKVDLNLDLSSVLAQQLGQQADSTENSSSSDASST